MSTAAPVQTPSNTPAAAGGGGQSIGDYVRRYVADVKAGELGSLPIIVGLIIIAIVFQSQNERFISAGNFVNLTVQAAGVMCIAMGVVFVLLLGEIDLSVGFVSGVAGVICALLLLPDGAALPAGVAIAAALAAGLAIGTLHGVLITKVGIPSFVVTLAGLLGWNGAVLLLIGSRGTIVLQDDLVVGFANNFLSDAVSLLAVLVAVGLYAAMLLLGRRSRLSAGLPTEPPTIILVRIGGLALILLAVVLFANQDRGIPYVIVVLAVVFLVWTFVLNRTRFGRHVYAVGGNAEAARRAGIDVDRIKVKVFAISSLMAALGGIILASRLRSVDPGAGGGEILLYSIAAAVIGGTSLFGGRGNIKSAVLGALVISSIANGLGLLGLSAGTKYVVTALVLLAAVTVDSISRKGRAQSGRA